MEKPKRGAWRKTIYTTKTNEMHSLNLFCEQLVRDKHHPHRNPQIEGQIGSGHCKRYPKYKDDEKNIWWCERHYPALLDSRNYQKPYITNPLDDIQLVLQRLSRLIQRLTLVTSEQEFQTFFKEHRKKIIENETLMTRLRLTQDQTLKYLTFGEQYVIAERQRSQKIKEYIQFAKIKEDEKIAKLILLQQAKEFRQKQLLELEAKKELIRAQRAEEETRKIQVELELERIRQDQKRIEEEEIIENRNIQTKEKQRLLQEEAEKFRILEEEQEQKRKENEIVVQKIRRDVLQKQELEKNAKEAKNQKEIEQKEAQERVDKAKALKKLEAEQYEKSQTIQKNIETIQQLKNLFGFMQRIRSFVKLFPNEDDRKQVLRYIEKFIKPIENSHFQLSLKNMMKYIEIEQKQNQEDEKISLLTTALRTITEYEYEGTQNENEIGKLKIAFQKLTQYLQDTIIIEENNENKNNLKRTLEECNVSLQAIEEMEKNSPLQIALKQINQYNNDLVQKQDSMELQEAKKIGEEIQTITTFFGLNSQEYINVNEIFQKNLKQPVRIYLRLNVQKQENLQKDYEDTKIIDYNFQPPTKSSGCITYYSTGYTKPEEAKTYGPFFSIFPHTFSIGNRKIYDQESISVPIKTQGDQPPVNQPMKGVFDLLRSGYNVTLCGYGYSGTGKTFTLFGEPNPPPGLQPEPGIIQLGLEELKNAKMFSIFEIYGKITNISKNRNGTVAFYQYFGKTPNELNLGGIKIQEEGKDIFTDEELIRYQTFTAKNLKKLENKIREHRKTKGRVKQTKNNDQSSRGHLFFLIELELETPQIRETETTRNTTTNTCYFTLIDMAGAENPEAISKDYFDFTSKDITINYQEFLTQIRNERSLKSLPFSIRFQPKIEEYINTELNKITDTDAKIKEKIKLRNSKFNEAVEIVQEGFYINDSITELTYFLRNQQYQREIFNEKKKNTIYDTLPKLNARNTEFPQYDEKNDYNNEAIFTVGALLTELPLKMSFVLTDLQRLGGKISKKETRLSSSDPWIEASKTMSLNNGQDITIIDDKTNYGKFDINNIKLQYILLVLVKADRDVQENEEERIKARIKTLEFANKFRIK
jgi:hypothetical protein